MAVWMFSFQRVYLQFDERLFFILPTGPRCLLCDCVCLKIVRKMSVHWIDLKWFWLHYYSVRNVLILKESIFALSLSFSIFVLCDYYWLQLEAKCCTFFLRSNDFMDFFWSLLLPIWLRFYSLNLFFNRIHFAFNRSFSPPFSLALTQFFMESNQSHFMVSLMF